MKKKRARWQRCTDGNKEEREAWDAAEEARAIQEKKEEQERRNKIIALAESYYRQQLDRFKPAE